MKRYNITSEITRGQQSVTGVAPAQRNTAIARIVITERYNGDWVRYEDAFVLKGLLRMVSANLHNPQLGGISDDQLEAIDSAIGDRG